MPKKLFAVGNWKMYKTAREAADFIEELVPLVEASEVKVYISVPYTSIHPATQYAKGTNIVVGAQNMNDAREGAFTGEIASLMVKEAGASFVLLGHSERRWIFNESNEFIHKKVMRALQDDIQPILCIGESAEEHKNGDTQQVLEEQILSALDGISKEEASDLILAYEPVWAIGTGKTPTPTQIQDVHAFCREILVDVFDKKKSGSIPILYGGSVKPENVASITNQKDVDGVLVGGASLDAQSFAQIIKHIEAGKAPTKSRKTRRKEKT